MSEFLNCVKIKISFFIVLLTSLKIFAWGALGHRTSAEVAYQLLDQETKNRISEILKTDDFASASTWADEVRAQPEWKYTIWYHFEKAPDNYTYLDNLKRQDDKIRKLGGAIESLFVLEKVLGDENETLENKSMALKFLIHIVGDIHQPLHTGRVEDNSGNKIPVKWLGQDMNLHQVWDSQMIYLAHKDILSMSSDVTIADFNLSAKSYSKYLIDKNKNFVPNDKLFARYDDWMHESMVPRSEAYDLIGKLSEQEYTNRFINFVDDRIFLSGVRIANTLNRILIKKKNLSTLDELKNKIQEIVGNFFDFVQFKPRSVVVNDDDGDNDADHRCDD